MSVRVSMIAAVAANNVIGRDGDMPWRLPSDMAFFRRTTMGKPIVMGRKQYEIFGKPLPRRVNIVVTRRPDYQPDGVLVMNDLDAAIDHAIALAEAEGGDEVVIIGGGEIYAQAMGRADRLYITHVAAEPDGDTVFPPIDPNVWQVAATVEIESDPRDSVHFHTRIYERRARPGFD